MLMLGPTHDTQPGGFMSAALTALVVNYCKNAFECQVIFYSCIMCTRPYQYTANYTVIKYPVPAKIHQAI